MRRILKFPLLAAAAALLAALAVACDPEPTRETAPVPPDLPALTASVGTTYEAVLPESDGLPAPTITLAGVPDGLKYTAATRTLAGTPAEPGTFRLEYTATNTAGEATAAFDLVVEPGVVRLQLDWLPNTNHIGIYAALEQGWYAEEGVELEILPYSGANGDLLIAEGVADVAFSFSTTLPFARAQGLEVVSIASVLQKSPTAIAVLADGPISRLRDLDGGLYGGFGLPYEQPQWTAVVKADGGEGTVSGVILSTAAYEALYGGDVQAAEIFVTWEGIEARQRGVELRTWTYQEFGIPDRYGVLLVAAESAVADNAVLLEGFLRATVRGYEFAAADPRAASDMLIRGAGEDAFPNVDLVYESAELLGREYFLDADGRWGSQTLERWTGYTSWLFEAGLLSDADGDPLERELDYEAMYSDALHRAALGG